MDEKKTAEPKNKMHSFNKKQKTNSSIDIIFKILATMATLFTLLFGILNYSDTKENEFRKAFWEKRFEFYEEATQLAATIAIAKNLDAVKEEREKFWALYWGKLSMIEDQEVLDAMVNYGDSLRKLEETAQPDSGLEPLSYALARACRNSLKNTWQPVKLYDLKKKSN